MMKRLGGWLFPALALLSMIARAAEDAPSEQASPIVVILFVVVFIAICIGFVAYTWWRGRKEKGDNPVG